MLAYFSDKNKIIVVPDSKEEMLLMSVFVQSDIPHHPTLSIGEMTAMSGTESASKGLPITWKSMEIVAEHYKCTCCKPKAKKK